VTYFYLVSTPLGILIVILKILDPDNAWSLHQFSTKYLVRSKIRFYGLQEINAEIKRFRAFRPEWHPGDSINFDTFVFGEKQNASNDLLRFVCFFTELVCTRKGKHEFKKRHFVLDLSLGFCCPMVFYLFDTNIFNIKQMGYRSLAALQQELG
jgi:hypothetical protein